jgi:hypothetical protein
MKQHAKSSSFPINVRDTNKRYRRKPQSSIFNHSIGQSREFSPEKIKQEASARAKQQPAMQRIPRYLIHPNKPFRGLILSCTLTEIRIALFCDGILDNYEFEYLNEQNFVRAIFRGKIQILEPE